MEILYLGNELLRQKSKPLAKEEINDTLRNTISGMFDLMLEKEGVGLAAPQIGILKRFFVIIADDNVRRVFINPQITATSAETCVYEEGCLSIPRLYENITRPAKITIQATNEKGKPFTLEADGYLARIIQHEYDHLDGILYIDRGDEAFKQKAAEIMAKREEKQKQKEKIKAAKAAKIAAKQAQRELKKR